MQKQHAEVKLPYIQLFKISLAYINMWYSIWAFIQKKEQLTFKNMLKCETDQL